MEAIKEELKVCEFCGKPYKFQEINVLGNTRMLQFAQCTCIQDREAEKEAKRQAEIKKEKLKTLFNNSMITPLFRKKTFEFLEAHAKEYGNISDVNKAKKYYFEFDPANSTGMLMIGRPGTGKTTLQAAICNALMQNGYACLFVTLSSLLDKFSSYSYEHAGDINALLVWLCQFDYIVLDDLGRESYTDKRKEVAFRIIDTLLNHEKVVSFTANPEMITKLKKVPEWGAALDRIKDICGITWEFRGESLRGLK